MSSKIQQAEFERRKRASVWVGSILLAEALVYLVWSALIREWKVTGVIFLVVVGVSLLLVAARAGRVRLAGYAFSLLTIFGVVTGGLVRDNPGYGPFFVVVGVVMAALTLQPRDVLVVAGVGFVGELLLAWWPYSQPQISSMGGLYVDGLMLLLLGTAVAWATSSSIVSLVADLLRRDAEATAADSRADALSLQLEQSQRLEALGRLSGGIAHDFNNLLTVMQSCASVIATKLPTNPELSEELKDLDDALARGAALTRQLLAFSRRDVVKSEVLDLGALLHHLSGLLQRLLGAQVELKWDLAEGPVRVWASASQLEQVVLNLAVNARDAMRGQGQLTLRLVRNVDPVAGERCQLFVTDTGPGMSAEVQAHIFEPFFSTKKAGGGTGLGLATVHSIVSRLGGAVAVQSEPGKGATFVVTLPVVKEAPAATVATLADVRPAKEVTVTIVDDEPLLRQTMMRILGGAGYQVKAFESAEEALADPGPLPDVLVSDVNLGGQSGAALAEQLLARKPGMRVVFVSGYTVDPAATARLVDRGAAFVPKPFNAADLLAAASAHGVMARTG